RALKARTDPAAEETRASLRTQTSPSSPSSSRALPAPTELSDETTRVPSVSVPEFAALGAGDEAEATVVDVRAPDPSVAAAAGPSAWAPASTVVGRHAPNPDDGNALTATNDVSRLSLLPPLERRWLIMALAALIALLGSLAWIFLAR
ncbi:MAG TPA: hypothetical protein VIA18_08560, partial [Polyangia bacterium]|nr:hypothetical protein [Polyangia bacterium]